MNKSTLFKLSVAALATAGILSLGQVAMAKEAQPNDNQGKEIESQNLAKENQVENINDDQGGHHDNLARGKDNQPEVELVG